MEPGWQLPQLGNFGGVGLLMLEKSEHELLERPARFSMKSTT
jgi:hypothetical protein